MGYHRRMPDQPHVSRSDAPVDVAIVGGGAAGLAAAIFTADASPSMRVAVLDGASQLGAKILVSGGGRCNVTHERVTPKDFNAPPHLVRSILKAFDEHAAVRWFEALGVTLKTEATGKLFPVTNAARTVLDALLTACRDRRIRLCTDHRVHSIAVRDDAFTITHQQGTMTAGKLVLAAGGRSLPRTGSDGSGWQLAQALGHTVTDTHAALVPLVLDDRFFHATVKGVAIDVTLATFAGSKRIDQRTGSLLFTHFGVSGPVVMDASRHWVIAKAQQQSPRLVANLLKDATFEAVERWLIEAGTAAAKRPVQSLVADRLPASIARTLCEHVGIDANAQAGQLSRDRRRTLVHALVELELPVREPRGWNYAEVTAGGIPLSEVDHRTMASRIVPNLYIVGEMLDCDGRIGGFNFQWAWATGFVAARAIAAASGSTG